MCTQPAPSAQALDGAPVLPQDEGFARRVLERQMVGLDELVALGLETVRSLTSLIAREARAEQPDPAVDLPAIGLAHHRADRAVRLSYALQHVVLDRLDGVARRAADRAERAERVRAAEAEARQAQAKAKAEAEDPVRARKIQIDDVVTSILSDVHGDDDAGFDRHVREAKERLRDHDVCDDVLGRPASEVIADICRLIGLEPNWEGLAFEAWAQEERESGKVGTPLQSPSPWMGKRPGIRGRLVQAEPPPLPSELAPQAIAEHAEAPPPPRPEIAQDPPPYIPPPDPDILPGYPVGLPGEYPPPRRPRRRYN